MSNVDHAEIAKFEALAHRWWDRESEFKPLHDINPLRVNWIDERVNLAGKMLEHVPDPSSVIRACYRMVKPGGQVFFSTINRNPKAYLFAIIGAEYIMKLLPRGTHDFKKFIRPSELGAWSREAGLSVKDIIGLTYNPLTKHYKLAADVDVNYMIQTLREE